MSKNYLSIFKGSINDEENVIIIDANRNKDLTDDSVYHVKNRDALVFCKVEFDVFDGNKIQNVTVNFEISPYSSLSKNGLPDFITFASNNYKEGFFERNN